jgi:hypothetical protein
MPRASIGFPPHFVRRIGVPAIAMQCPRNLGAGRGVPAEASTTIVRCP